MAAVFTIDNAAFTRMFQNLLGIKGHHLPNWNMRLSVAKDAQVQNDILLNDFTRNIRNLVVVGRQPHPNSHEDPPGANFLDS